ncbi:MAG: hypothetical protein H0Z37_08490, partial [Firmicutes bacterium]|nr:hypothetical protein [Bacillota bacterium]
RGVDVPPAREFVMQAGAGAAARVGARMVHIGNRAWFAANEIDAEPLAQALAAADADGALPGLTTVGSRPAPGGAVVDAGSKVLSSDPSVTGDGTFGLVAGRPDVRVVRLSEEHGILSVDPGGPELRVGDRLHIIPNHVCPAVNLSDVLYGYRNRQVVREIPVAARGRFR